MSFVSLDRNVLFATAIVSVIVNGYNSASFKDSSEHYIDGLDGRETKHPFRRYFGPAVCQFISDLIISVVSLIPLFLMGNMPNAIVYSYLITLAVLFVAGYYRAYLLNMPRWRDALEIATLVSASSSSDLRVDGSSTSRSVRNLGTI